MYQALTAKYKFTPQQIAEMTLDQQLVLLDNPKYITFNTFDEYMRWLQDVPK